MRVFRLCKQRYSTSVLSGDGGLHADGRWHSRGRRIVYCASSEALAVLELRVHIGGFVPRDSFMMHEIEVADAQLEQFDLSRLPPDWNSVPHSSTSQAIGDEWLEQRRSAALRVPSLHSRTEFNVLLNPGHGRADLFATLRTWTHHSDPRMFP